MTHIQILPTRLANQIAAGEVVERPASVVKELLENSLDAGATDIRIDIEKGGAKRICITDNGSGIAKEELALALSRHATSKIKSLDDLEGIASLGFRGEALASISSVSRLTLTSTTAEQDMAWQAFAEGSQMVVKTQPAALPQGTRVEILDLFFNTPARRKFLRTEKTEFAHIEEVIKRIALVKYAVTFSLYHNGKLIKQYKKLSKEQHQKRIAQVCGKAFIEHALTVKAEHDGMQLYGWIAEPSFVRPQNDLCYSYVNGRMMRDKLINHAIRQAYADTISNDTYPAFVLFFELDVREVDVNVHPAKHEVRFHQARYVHDFILSVVQQALANVATTPLAPSYQQAITQQLDEQQSYKKPLTAQNAVTGYSHGEQARKLAPSTIRENTVANYQRLYQPLTPASKDDVVENLATDNTEYSASMLVFEPPHFVLCQLNKALKLVNLVPIQHAVVQQKLKANWQTGLVAQPLLLPMQVTVSGGDGEKIAQHHNLLQKLGFELNWQASSQKIQVKKMPQMLREVDVATTVKQLVDLIPNDVDEQNALTVATQMMSQLLTKNLTEASCRQLWQQAQQALNTEFFSLLELNSAAVDLTSMKARLMGLSHD